MYRIRVIHFIGLLGVLVGCASQLPPTIRHAPPQQPQPKQVQATPEHYLGQAIRWGGRIIEVRNEPDHTDVLVLAYPLEDDGEPIEDREALGRFIARFSGFVEPEAFPQTRWVTFSGILQDVERHKIGEYAYPYPVIRVTAWHLWPEPEPVHYYYDPWPWGWGYYPAWWYPHPHPHWWW